MNIIRLILLLPFTAMAQDSLRTIQLKEIVFSANKTEEKKEDIPRQINIIKAEQIAFSNVQTSADILQQSGHVYVQKSQMGGGSPIIRGFEANKVLLVVDGVRMNNAIYRSGHLQNIITLDPGMIERMEVINGAGSTIYGSDAIGGVVAIFTKKPLLSPDSQLHLSGTNFLRYSSANHEKTLHTSLNFGFRKVAFLTGFSISDFDDLRKGALDNPRYPGFGDCRYYVKRINGRDSVINNPDPDVQKFSGYSQLSLLQKVLFQPNSYNRHLLNFQYSTSSNIPRYDRLQSFSATTTPRFSEWYYGPQIRYQFSYEWLHTRASLFYDFFRITPSAQQVEESRHVRRFGRDRREDNTEKVNVFSLNADYFKTLKQHELRYGVEAATNYVRSTGLLVDITIGSAQKIAARYPDNSTMNMLGIYASHHWEITPRIILSDGLRYSFAGLHARFDSTFFNYENPKVTQRSPSLNGNIGIVFLLPKEFRLSAVLSTAFRSPNIDDLGKSFETNAGDLVVPNPDLKPEQILYKEVSFSKVFAEKLSTEIAVFHSRLSQALVVRPFKVNGKDSVLFNGNMYKSLASANTGEAEVYGVSASATLQINAAVAVKTGFTYTKGQDLTNSAPLDHIPPPYGNFSLTYERRKFSTQFYVSYNLWKRLTDYSPSGEDNSQYATPDGTPAWYTLNLKGSFELTKQFNLQAGIENILDLNYRTFASGINAPGRNLIISLHYTFR